MITFCNVEDCKYYSDGGCEKDFDNVTVEIEMSGYSGTVHCSDYEEIEDEE
jgi:hypothetical protein